MWTFLDFRIITILETNLSHSLSLLLRNVRAPPKKRPLQIFRFGFSPINKVDSIFTVHCQINHYLIIYKSLHFTLTPFYINFQTHSHPYPHSLSLSRSRSLTLLLQLHLSLSLISQWRTMPRPFQAQKPISEPWLRPQPDSPAEPGRSPLPTMKWAESEPAPVPTCRELSGGSTSSG